MERKITFYGKYFSKFYAKQNKKTQKTPKRELELAIKLKSEYFATKKKGV